MKSVAHGLRVTAVYSWGTLLLHAGIESTYLVDGRFVTRPPSSGKPAYNTPRKSHQPIARSNT